MLMRALKKGLSLHGELFPIELVYQRWKNAEGQLSFVASCIEHPDVFNIYECRYRKVDLEMLKLAEHILQSKAADFDPSRFVDRYEEAVTEMLKKKQAGMPVPRDHAAPRPQNVENLMDALRRSMALEKVESAPQKKGRKRLGGQGEMLLPIPGKKGPEAVAKPTGHTGARQKKAG